MQTTSYEEVFFALADPTRCRILGMLQVRDGQRLVELNDNFAMSRQAVRRHIHVLESAGLVTTHRAAGDTAFFINRAPLRACSNWLAQFCPPTSGLSLVKAVSA